MLPLDEVLSTVELVPVLDRTLAGREAKLVPVPGIVHPNLRRVIEERFPDGLYTHQADAIEKALAGNNVVLATATASGKSLAFAVPALQALIHDPLARCIFMYPTKALASDQLTSLENYARSAGLGDVVRRIDGDVQNEARDEALAVGRVFLTNADMIHMTMLRRNNDPAWQQIFDHLAVVVLDESHVYRGAFGSNMAYVVRRLRQVARKHGSSPSFLAASATSSDPAGHLESLVGQPFEVVGVDNDGSSQAERRIVMAVPEVPRSQGGVWCDLLASLVQGQHRFIAFAGSRRGTELLLADLRDKHPESAENVLPYRAGYEAKDRKQIEQALNSGALQGVISTSALELGVDIANMDTCVMFGLPPSVMAFWQRAGRVGREAGRIGNVLVMPATTAVDLYYQAHPEDLLKRPLETLVVQLDNRRVVISHFACARAERPKGQKYSPAIFDVDIFGEGFIEFARLLEDLDLDEDILITPEPHFDVGIRGIADPSFDILNLDSRLPFDVAYDVARQRRLGTISYSQILNEAYPRAVYWHMGQPYRVNRLKYHDQQVLVEKMQDMRRRTFPIGEVRVNPKQTPASSIFRQSSYGGDVEWWHTMMSVRRAVRGCREREGERWVDNHTYAQPLISRIVTEGVWLRLPPEFGPRSSGGLFAVANAMANAYTILKPCEPTDIAAMAVMNASDGSSRIYLYDDVEGGLAITQSAYDMLSDLISAARDRLANCAVCVAEDSDAGCPACAQSSYSYVTQSVSRSEGISLLDRLAELVKAGPEGRPFVSDTFKRRTEGTLTSVSAEALRDEVVRAADSMARRFFPVGSTLRTVTGDEGVVAETWMNGRDRAYLLDIETSKVPKQFRDNGTNLQLVEGEPQKECLGCGETGLDWDEDPCPNCGANIRLGQ